MWILRDIRTWELGSIHVLCSWVRVRGNPGFIQLVKLLILSSPLLSFLLIICPCLPTPSLSHNLCGIYYLFCLKVKTQA